MVATRYRAAVCRVPAVHNLLDTGFYAFARSGSCAVHIRMKAFPGFSSVRVFPRISSCHEGQVETFMSE
jgi:hypothetical protein